MICKPFSEKDPRLDYALHDCEPLIHFALNCGAKSCPPIKTFSAKGIKSELKVATEAFLSTDDAVIIDPGSECVRISKIFKWYRDDFGRTDEEVLTFIYDHMAAEDPRRADLGILIKSGFSLDYLHYDWG